jgi:hypothetical protein
MTLQDTMLSPASMPPSFYVADAQASSLLGLLEFGRSGSLNAQTVGGTAPFNLSFTPYANWPFGVWASANGESLSTALWGANMVAGSAHYPPQFSKGVGAEYT